MMLCIQNILPTAGMLLFDENHLFQDHVEWNGADTAISLHKKTEELLSKQHIAIRDITEIMAVSGPGPFTRVRSLAVMLQVWKSENAQLQLYAVPLGKFLEVAFPAADHLLLSAGRTAFFSFSNNSPEHFTKHKQSDLKSLTGEYGGYLLNPPGQSHLKSAYFQGNQKTFADLLARKNQFATDSFLPVYGAEPSIA